MIRAGLVAIVVGVLGLLAHLVIAIAPKAADLVTGGAWAAIGIGVLLVLSELAQDGYGPGVFLLAAGVGLLIAQKITHFADPIKLPHTVLDLIATALIGVGAIAVSLADDGDEAFIRLPVFAAASLVTDIFVDFGPGWDQLMNVSTAFFVAAAAVAAAVALGDELYDPTDLDMVIITAAAGAGLAGVLITTMASFDFAQVVDILLTLPAVLGGWLVVPLIAYFAIIAGGRATGTQADVVNDAIDSTDDYATPLGALITGYLAVAAVFTVALWDLPLWLVIALIVTALAAAGFAVTAGYLAIRELARRIRAAATLPRIAAAMRDLRRSNPVFRLLPEPEKP